MTKQQQIAELKKMVDRTIRGYTGKDATTRVVNRALARAYHDLCFAYNAGHGWVSKSKKKATIE